MLSLGYDIGSSFIKCNVLEIESGILVASGSYPVAEMSIDAPKHGWAEQDPEVWWANVKFLTRNILREHNIHSEEIQCIGISYQMHGLVCVDHTCKVLRPSIIWCDSRAVDIGKMAFEKLGKEFCLQHLLNSPGNFTASKLCWIKEYEPELFNTIYKIMLPGEFIAMKLTGEICTTISGLSEGVLWDFKNNRLSHELLEIYGMDAGVLPKVCHVFSVQGELTQSSAEEIGLRKGTVVSYRAGDQPNNAFSLNVLNPGEIAATAGTSGVVYGVTDKLCYDKQSRVNQFAHVNHSDTQTRLGVLLCINGTGILNSWMKKNVGYSLSYDEINQLAGTVNIGSDGLSILPFGNGAERVLENANIGAGMHGLDLNRHTKAHIFRAAQEGIAFSFRYGIDIMREMGLDIRTIRTGFGNMFLSPVFRQTLANITGTKIEIFDTDGAQGAARGAALGAGLIKSFQEAFQSLKKREELTPIDSAVDVTYNAYESWLSHLRRNLKT